jgi:membrane protease YdiL (CAAX protease family)
MLRDQLADFRSYLAAPRLTVPARLRDGWRGWAIMVGLYLAGLTVLGPLLALWSQAWNVSPAAAFKDASTPLLVLAFPIAEEVIFRGWLTGRPRALWLLTMALIVAALLVPVTLGWHDQLASLGVIATAIAALAGWWRLRKRTDPPRWFGRSFAVWFYLSVAVFGFAHLANYPRLSWAVVPMVCPQLLAGLVFGYLRMRWGLIASIMAHAAGNAAALAAALLAGL